jgi:hypothetical protein
MTPAEPQPADETTASEPEPKAEDAPAPPSLRYGATIKLIQSRLADAERTKAKPWWKLK